MSNPIQAMCDAMSEEWARQRSLSQMTLGQAIESLKAMPQDAPVAELSPLGSYRGYYRDLAFGSRGDRTRHPGAFGWGGDDWQEWGKDKAPDDAVVPCPPRYETVADVLADCLSALGSCFEGYKGGDYWMTAATPMWVSGYGTASGMRLMALELREGGLVAVTSEESTP